MRVRGSRATVQLSHTIDVVLVSKHPLQDSTSEVVRREAPWPQTRRSLTEGSADFAALERHLFGEFDERINRTGDWCNARHVR